MTKIFLVDDAPLVLIGMQGMLNWAELGYTVVGTARNGAEALKAIGETYPDIVVSDIRMPVMDGFTLAESCHKDGSALPVFIMLTSYEEFDYVKRSMRLGVVDYLVKIDLTAESLTAALDKARAAVEKERRLQAPAAPAVSMDSYRDRLFLQLYGGLLTDRAAFDRQCAELWLDFHAPQYVVALGSIRTPELSTEQLLTLSTGVTRMAAETLPKYRPCRVIGMDLQHFSALLPLQEGEDPETALTPALQATGQILYNYFSSQIYWAVGRAVPDILQISQSRQDALAAQQLLRSESPHAFYHEKPNTPLDHRAQVVAQVQQYIRAHLAEKLTLNDVAAVFNFSPNYLSQLFAQNSERGFVEYVTTARIAAAKELMAATALKIYEVSSRVGFDSAFYFSKVFKKLEGASPREYIQRMKGSYVDAKDDAALCRDAPHALPALPRPRGVAGPAGRCALAGGGTGRPARCRRSAAAAALAVAAIYPKRRPRPMGTRLFCPPPHPLCAGNGRGRDRGRQLSARYRRCRMGDLRGKRVAAARPQQLYPRHAPAAAARCNAADRGPVCRRARRTAGHCVRPAGCRP